MRYISPRHLFLCSPSIDLWIAVFSFVLAVIISYLWRTFLGETLVSPLIRGIVVFVVVGIISPLYWMVVVRKKSLDTLGLSKRGWLPNLLVGMFLGGSLFLVYSLSSGINRTFNPVLIIYLSFLGLPIFIHGWLQLRFEEAFGLIPAVVLTGICFSLVNLGAGWYDSSFFMALFGIGLLMASIFQFT